MRVLLVKKSPSLDEIQALRDLRASKVYIVNIYDSRTMPPLTENNEALLLAKFGEIVKIAEKVEECGVEVVCMDVAFSSEEILNALEKFKPDLTVSMIDVPPICKPFLVLREAKQLFRNVLYVITERASNEIFEYPVDRVFLLGVVEPVMPPEISSKVMSEKEEEVKQKLDELSKVAEEKGIEVDTAIVRMDVSKAAEMYSGQASMVAVSTLKDFKKVAKLGKSILFV